MTRPDYTPAQRAYKPQPQRHHTAPRYYRIRLAKKAAPVSLRLWYGPPADPITGEPLDRSWRWQCLVSGEPADIEDVAPWIIDGTSEYPIGDEITEAEAKYMDAIRAHDTEHEPTSPMADPRKAVDFNQMKAIRF